MCGRSLPVKKKLKSVVLNLKKTSSFSSYNQPQNSHTSLSTLIDHIWAMVVLPENHVTIYKHKFLPSILRIDNKNCIVNVLINRPSNKYLGTLVSINEKSLTNVSWLFLSSTSKKKKLLSTIFEQSLLVQFFDNTYRIPTCTVHIHLSFKMYT